MALLAALDTNVLGFFLVQDDAAQLAAARTRIRRRGNAGETLCVPVTVWLELESALRSNFGLSQPEVVRTRSQLLSSAELRFESAAAHEPALGETSDAAADHSDGLHAALASPAGQSLLWTFDRADSKFKGACEAAAG